MIVLMIAVQNSIATSRPIPASSESNLESIATSPPIPSFPQLTEVLQLYKSVKLVSQMTNT